MIEIGDLVVPVTREWDKKRYIVNDIFQSKLTGYRLLEVSFIGSVGEPRTMMAVEKLFEKAPPKEEKD